MGTRRAESSSLSARHTACPSSPRHHDVEENEVEGLHLAGDLQGRLTGGGHITS